jgi:tetratricopeptide (TPR) repeat protein
MNVNKAIQLAYKYFQAGDLIQTERVCREILKKQPNNIDILYFLGVVCYQLKKYDSAIQYIGKFLQFNPTNADAYYNLAQAFQKKREPDDAITYYHKALKYNPYFIDAYLNLGNLLQETGQLDEAIKNYQKVIEINPNFAGAYYNLGVVLQEKGQLREAISAYQKAIHLNPSYIDAYHDLGYVYHMNSQFDEAIRFYQKALQLNPKLFDAHNNLGRVLQEQRHNEEAIACYQKAIQLNPDFAEAHFNLSIVLLLLGNFKQGWREYEWRWKLKEQRRYNFPQPVWDGSDIEGRTIFLYAEQGFGDTIQFIRFVPLVAERRATVIIECQRELKSLLQTVQGVAKVITNEDQLPDFDIHCPLLSLPLLLGIALESIPAAVPYIAIESMLIAKWKERLKHDNSQFKIGIVWSGNPRNMIFLKKSFALNTFLPLASLDKITLYSLQKGEAAREAKNPPQGMRLIDYTDEINEFLDTAAFIKNLDLVISIDTAVAHLAGALGKTVWTLLPFSPDWRWMLNREDSPWYPTMRLFRQSSPGDWETVIEKVSNDLHEKIRENDVCGDT